VVRWLWLVFLGAVVPAARAGPAVDLAAAAVVYMWDLEPTFDAVLAAVVVLAASVWAVRKIYRLLGGA